MRIGSLSRKITLANSKLRAVWGSGALSTACHSLLPLSRFRLDLGLIHIPLIVGPLLGSEVLDMTCTFDSHTTIQRLGMLFNIAHGRVAKASALFCSYTHIGEHGRPSRRSRAAVCFFAANAGHEIKTSSSRWVGKDFSWQRALLPSASARRTRPRWSVTSAHRMPITRRCIMFQN